MPTDHEIISAIKENPNKGMGLLMKAYMKPVYWHIRRLVVAHADAQDAMQETFVRVFRSFSQYNDSVRSRNIMKNNRLPHGFSESPPTKPYGSWASAKARPNFR